LAGKSLFPVMEMPQSIRIWRKVRFPLLALCAVIALTIIGSVTNNVIVAYHVEERIAEARKMESLGTMETVIAAGETLSELSAALPERQNAQAAWAWQAVLEATWFGAQDRLVSEARIAIDRADGADPATIAARVGLACLENNPKEGLAALNAAGGRAEPRLALAQAWLETAQGEPGKAMALIGKASGQYPGYIPLVVEGMRTAYLSGDQKKTRLWTHRLKEILPNHLWANLVQIALALPQWGQATSSEEAGRQAVAFLKKLAPQIEEAPPRLHMLGQELQGRALLAVQDVDGAVQILGKGVVAAPSPEQLAWYALAVMLRDGPRAALEILDKRKDLSGPVVVDVRAQALLAMHRVTDAQPLIEELEKSSKFLHRARLLRFVALVRQGDEKEALEHLPERLQSDFIWPALELYDQVAALGRQKAVVDVIAAISKVDSDCGNALWSWHGKSDREAIRELKRRSQKSACASALQARFLFGRDDPKQVLEAANIARKAAGHSLWEGVIRGRATYLVQGRDGGMDVLDQIAAAQPQGSPLRVALGRAYLRLTTPSKALGAIKGDDSDAALALQIDASNEKDKGPLIAEAVERFQKEHSPMLAYFAALQLQQANRHPETVELVTSVAPHAGAFGPRLAGLGASSLVLMGKKREADRFLDQLSRSLKAPAGQGASWDAQTEMVMLNLRRGGQFTIRVMGLVSDLISRSVRSADLLYAFAMANIIRGNERGGTIYLRDAIFLDPSHAQSCKQLLAMNKLGSDLRDKCLSARPDLQLLPVVP
jgi:hypothetical protein